MTWIPTICIVVMLVCIALIMVSQQKNYWNFRCTLRREFTMLEGVHEITKGIASDDLEAAAGALMEYFQRMQTELNWQNTHSWSIRHPFQMPEWPDYASLHKY